MDTTHELVISAIKSQIDDPTREIGLDSRISELGLDSLRYMMLIIDLESSSDQISVDVKNIGSATTVADLARLVRHA